MQIGDLIKIKQTGFVGMITAEPKTLNSDYRVGSRKSWLIRLAVTMFEAEFLEKDLEIIYKNQGVTV